MHRPCRHLVKTQHRYQQAYASRLRRSAPLRGELWPVLFDRLIIILGSFAIFTSCQLLTKQAWFQAVTIFLTAPFLLFKFWSIQRKRHALVSEHIPLDIAWRQPKASVPPQMYIASELRSGAVGWHPEQGKAWSGYGLPRFL